jgi:hypothetical protein
MRADATTAPQCTQSSARRRHQRSTDRGAPGAVPDVTRSRFGEPSCGRRYSLHPGWGRFPTDRLERSNSAAQGRSAPAFLAQRASPSMSRESRNARKAASWMHEKRRGSPLLNVNRPARPDAGSAGLVRHRLHAYPSRIGTGSSASSSGAAWASRLTMLPE